MAKIDISHQTFGFVPTTMMTILGTHVDGKVNYMALGWLARVNFKPAMIAICVNKTNKSCDGILDQQQFSINVPTQEMIALTDYVGLVSAKHTGKSNLFESFYGKLPAAPLIRDCPLNVELELKEKVELPTNYTFIGEVVAIHANEEILTNGTPDVSKMNTFMLSMPDNRYWALGECVGHAWKDGQQLKKKS